MAWVVPAGWQEFVQLYRMLQQTKVPAQFQPAQRALLTAGATFIDQSNHDVTVFDEDVGKWLNSVQLFGARIRSEAMQQAAAAGQSAPTGVFSDAADYWGVHPVQLLQAAGDAIKTPLEGAAVFAAVALAAWLILPPVIRALRT
jgi:hypothetical protein